jgi:DNA repair protein RadA/Sms
MKVKTKVSFVCQECGYDSPSWLGKCPECGAWNSLKEISNVTYPTAKGQWTGGSNNKEVKPKNLKEIVYQETSRIPTEYQEMNTVLGGGIVAGSVSLIAGDPGVGKSTLLLQLCLSLALSGKKILYVSGEESVEQIKMRAERIQAQHGTRDTGQETKNSKLETGNKGQGTGENLFLLALSDADVIVAQVEQMKPDLLVIDSIQTIESQNVSGLSGSVAQVRYGALQFVRCAKQNNIPVIIVGHVTKEGMVAGPMVLSHMVDTVLFLEGEKFAKTRILRSLKNRFGPVDEVGIFLMEENGMTEAKNPEQLFLGPSVSAEHSTPGSVLASTMEGSRAFLVEIQALVVSSKLPMPRRVSSGFDPKRLELLLAVLQKHARLPVDSVDVFVNVAGGLRLSDPGVDLGVCLAVYSSLQNVALRDVVGIAEVGLLGELRAVNGLDKREREAKKLGFERVLSAKTYKTLRDAITALSR